MEQTIKKIEIKGVKKTVIEVDSNEIDRIINEFYELGHKYEVIAYEEWSNYEKHTFDVDGDDLDDEDAKEAIDLLTTKDIEHFTTLIYLNYMAKVGAIEKGEYLVSVFW